MKYENKKLWRVDKKIHCKPKLVRSSYNDAYKRKSNLPGVTNNEAKLQFQ